MKAVILAAGRGTRMRHLTATIPKPLLKVKGKAFIERLIFALPSEVDEVIVVIGYKGDKIREFLGSRFRGKRIRYVQNNRITLGNAYSLMLTRDFFEPRERFIVMYADEVTSQREIKRCLSHKFSWVTHIVEVKEKASVATLSSTGRIIHVVEKPKRPSSNLVPGGILLINADIFSCRLRKHQNGEYYLTSMMAQFIKSHPVMAVAGTKNLYFSTPEDIDRFNKAQ
ncbi:MAG: nucleotidyltransferase family protein [bacterium]|nr:nucleotidyltransferase family protein [bacterium]